MLYIVNLSSVITYDLEKSKDTFVKLCNDYSSWFWAFSCCPTFFHSPRLLNKTWVGLKYLADLWSWNIWKCSWDSIINNYKLGKLPTEEFLEKFSTMLSFLAKNEKIREKTSELAKQEGYFITIDEHEEDLQKIAIALLERAWTAGISISENDKQKIDHFVELAKKGEHVYFISNSNSLDINLIIYLMSKVNQAINWEGNKEVIFSSNLEEEPMITIGENIHLCLSYRYGAFKTPKENKPFQGTPGLVQTLLAQLKPKEGEEEDEDEKKKDINDIKIISQYQKDLEVTPNIPKENLYLAENYYREELEQYGMKQKVM